MKNFDYTKDTQAFMKELIHLEKVLKEKNIEMLLGYGTLLGSIREKDFLQHDDDVDVFYIAEQNTLKEAMSYFENKIQPYLESKGYRVKYIEWRDRGRVRRMFGQYHLIINNIIIDLWIAWFNHKDSFNLSPLILDEYTKEDFLPTIDVQLRDRTFRSVKNPEKLLEKLYGNWKTPDPSFKPKIKDEFLQKFILKIIDVPGWAYHFTTKEQQLYSLHKIDYKVFEDFMNSKKTQEYDIIYVPSPGMSVQQVPLMLDKIRSEYSYTTKLLCAYSGSSDYWYKTADVIVPISMRDIDKLTTMYSSLPVAFLPEAVDTKYFRQKELGDSFVVGYAGRNGSDKRTHLLDRFGEIKRQLDHGKEFFTDNRTLDPMRDFYNSIDCLLMLSSHECMSRTTLEAMATGLPVISTDVGSIRYLLDPEWIVTATTDEEIVKEVNEKLNTLRNDATLRRAVGARNRRRIEQFFSWKNNMYYWDNMFNLLYKYTIDENQKADVKNKMLANSNEFLDVVGYRSQSTPLDVMKVIDDYGWAYHFIFKEQLLHTKHNYSCYKITEKQIFDLSKYNIVYFHSPNMWTSKSDKIITELRQKHPRVKIIGAYGGEVKEKYADADLIVAISLKHMKFLKELYPNKNVVYLPECVDTEYFTQQLPVKTRFNVGWVGRPCKVKRPELLDKLDFKVMKKQDWAKQYFVENRTLDSVKEFLRTIDVLVLTSSSECMPRCVLEAMACGIPVVSTDVGSMRLLLDSKWLVSVDEDKCVKEMNKALKILKYNFDIRKQVGEYNRERVEKLFSWKATQSLWDQVFEHLALENYTTIRKITNNFLLNFSGTCDVSEYLSIIPETEKLVQKNEEPEIEVNVRTIEDEQRDFLKALVESKVEFWLLKSTCLDCIKYQKLYGATMHLGTKNPATKKIIENIYAVNKFDFEVNIVVECRRIKPFQIYNIPVSVPLPVVQYLEGEYNMSYKMLMEKKE